MALENLTSMDQLLVGQKAIVTALTSAGLERRRMIDLGFVSGTLVEVLHHSPAGDPVAYGFRGAVIALRRSDARQVLVEL